MGNLLHFGGFLGPEDEADEAGEGNGSGDEVAEPTPFYGDMQSFRGDDDVTAANHRHKKSRDEGDQVAEFVICDL